MNQHFDEATAKLVAQLHEANHSRSEGESVETTAADLLMALTSDALVSPVLAAAGITGSAVSRAIGEDTSSPGSFAKVMEAALRTALTMGQAKVSPMHVLVALISTPGTDATDVLADLGVDTGLLLGAASLHFTEGRSTGMSFTGLHVLEPVTVVMGRK